MPLHYSTSLLTGVPNSVPQKGLLQHGPPVRNLLSSPLLLRLTLIAGLPHMSLVPPSPSPATGT